MNSQRLRPPTLSRREWLRRSAGGLGSVALSSLLTQWASAAPDAPGALADPLAPRAPHFAPRAKRVILLYMTGGASHVDSFDYKPKLFADHGKTLTIDNWQGNRGEFKRFLKRPDWEFHPGGTSGIPVSDLFPHTRAIVDDLCLINSMESDHTNHYEATLEIHTGSFTFARPSLGAWVSYGLGTENQNLPSFLAIAPRAPYAGTQTWGADFLPGCHQGTHVVPGPTPIANITPRVAESRLQRLELERLAHVNRQHAATRELDAALEARIKSFETAYGMQHDAPEAFDLTRESAETHQLYGLEPGSTQGFAWQCLVARRLAERGVRFIELIDTGSSNNWDSHGNMQDHVALAKNVDQAMAALVMDLKRRGMLAETLVVWTTEFGRTPYHEQATHPGREHHHQVFSSWLAGGGVKPGYVHGASDEYGIAVADKRLHVHDFHATILHLLGLDHERLTYRHSGRDYRLTDVAGRVAHDMLA
ncbi:MAG: DUF1501 domain-containing protein [Planctomycetaceae bacterium]|nr:DUF1501 domain-containing protein [Planctomycetaceae bacterium]